MRKVMLGILSYTSEPKLATLLSFVFSLGHLQGNGFDVEISARFGDGILPRARNSIVGEFLKGECDDLVMIDDDVSWKPEALPSLLSHNVDMVAGVYPMKIDEPTFPLRLLKDRQFLVAENNLLEVETVPAGFLRMSRQCLTRMRDAYIERAYHDTATNDTAWALFDFEARPEGYWGEDYLFCRRWRDIGGRVWIDPEMKLQHVGLKTYSGCVGDWFRSRPGYEEAWEQFSAMKVAAE